MKIAILIPVHNEAEFLEELLNSVGQKGYDTIVINDGSTDQSGDIAKRCGATVITNKEKSGKGSSLRKGFDYILENKYNGVITLDGDGQHDPGDIDQFINPPKKYLQNIIVGNRMRDPKGMPVIRYLTNRFMSGLVSLMCNQNIPDTQCGYRYISCSVLNDIQLSSNGFEIESEILIKATKKGYKVYSVPIETIYRHEESKINPIKDTYMFFVYLCRELFSKK